MNMRMELWVIYWIAAIDCVVNKLQMVCSFATHTQEPLFTITENSSKIISHSRVFEIDHRKVYKLRYDPKIISHNNTNYVNDFDPIAQSSIKDFYETAEVVNEVEKELSKHSLLNVGTGKSKLFLEYLKSFKNISSGNHAKKESSLINKYLQTLLYGMTLRLVRSPHIGKSLLSLFEIIQFKNVQCTGSLNGIRYVNGTCYPHLECFSLGGLTAGVCANGYGVCCIFKYSCNATTSELISYFESPQFPLAFREPFTCTLGLKIAQNVKQVRLDFLVFELRRPSNGDCNEDKFVVTGHSSNFKVPVLCGVNSGQHIYIEVEQSAKNTIFLSIFGTTQRSRVFNIRILQLNEMNSAPSGCLQYHTTPHGYIKSFNYDEDANTVETRTASYLNNLNYAICFKKLPGKCFITYSSAVDGTDYVFQIINLDEENMRLTPIGQAGVTVYNCPNDFILINAIRLCGDRLNDGSLIEDFTQNAPITNYGNGPITLEIRTDSTVVGRGFKLYYYQETCV